MMSEKRDRELSRRTPKYLNRPTNGRSEYSAMTHPRENKGTTCRVQAQGAQGGWDDRKRGILWGRRLTEEPRNDAGQLPHNRPTTKRRKGREERRPEGERITGRASSGNCQHSQSTRYGESLEALTRTLGQRTEPSQENRTMTTRQQEEQKNEQTVRSDKP
ncbi:hypothetical protein ACROYT_G022581 [Oculina patagonica]